MFLILKSTFPWIPEIQESEKITLILLFKHDFSLLAEKSMVCINLVVHIVLCAYPPQSIYVY